MEWPSSPPVQESVQSSASVETALHLSCMLAISQSAAAIVTLPLFVESAPSSSRAASSESSAVPLVGAYLRSAGFCPPAAGGLVSRLHRTGSKLGGREAVVLRAAVALDDVAVAV